MVRCGIRQRLKLCLEECEGAVNPSRRRGCIGSTQRQLDDVDTVRVGIRRVPAKQFECQLVVLRRLVRSAHGEGLVAGLDAGEDGGADISRQPRVPCQFGCCPLDLTRGDCARVRRVQSHSLSGQEIPVGGLGEKRVSERVATRGGGHEDVSVDRISDRLVEPRGIEIDHVCKQFVRDPAPGHRAGPNYVPSSIIELVDANEEKVGEVGGERASAHRSCSDQLLSEERVALRELDDAAHVAVRYRAGSQGAHEDAHVVVGQRGQGYARDARRPRPLGQGCTQRMASVQVVASIGRHDRGARDAAREQEAEHLAGRAVRPVHVLDHNEQRNVGRKTS